MSMSKEITVYKGGGVKNVKLLSLQRSGTQDLESILILSHGVHHLLLNQAEAS